MTYKWKVPSWPGMWILALCSSVVGLAAVRTIPPEAPQDVDYGWYYSRVAARLVAGAGLQGRVRYPPGYPMIVAAVYWTADGIGVDRTRMVLLNNVLMATVSSLLLFAICRQLTGAGVAWIASLLWIFYPLRLYQMRLAGSDTCFIAFLLAALLAIILTNRTGSASAAMISGLLLGLSALIRPIVLLLPLILAGLLLLSRGLPMRRRVLGAILIVGVYAVVLTPWEIYAYRSTGKVIPLSIGGPSGMLDGLRYGAQQGPRPEDDAPEDVLQFMRDIDSHSGDLTEIGPIVRFCLENARSRPLTMVKLLVLKMVRSWYATHSRRYDRYGLMVQVPYLLAGGIGLILAMRSPQIPPAPLAVLVATIVLFWAMTTAVLSIVNYMIPVMSLVCFLAAIPLDRAVHRLRGPDSGAAPSGPAFIARIDGRPEKLR